MLKYKGLDMIQTLLVGDEQGPVAGTMAVRPADILRVRSLMGLLRALNHSLREELMATTMDSFAGGVIAFIRSVDQAALKEVRDARWLFFFFFEPG